MRYFLLDKVTSIEIGKVATGVKCVTLTDETLHDHFPDHPILPGALITEGLAQLSGFLLEISVNTESTLDLRRAVLVQIDKMKFHNHCGPGDRLEFRAIIESLHEDAAQLSVEALSEGEKKAAGRLTFALLKIDSPKITAQRVEVYKLWTRDLKHCPTLR